MVKVLVFLCALRVLCGERVWVVALLSLGPQSGDDAPSGQPAHDGGPITEFLIVILGAIFLRFVVQSAIDGGIR